MNRKMKKRELEESLRRAVQREAPDVLPSILAAVEDQRRIRLMENPVKEKKMRRPLVWAVMATAAALVLVAGSLLGYALLGRVESIATIDVNPSVELRIGRKEKVTGVTALNADAQGLLDGMDLKGTDLNVAINALIGSMVRCGYISELKNSVLVSVEDSNAARGQKLQEEITADITQALEQSAIEAAVLSQTLDMDQTLQQMAEQYAISVGKAKIITKILAKDPTLTAQALAGLPINDLSLILLSKEPEADGVASSGQVSDKKYIGEEKAREIALAKVPGGRVVKAEYDMEDGRIVYEVEVLLNGVEHDFDIDALTGDVLKWDQELDEDDDKNNGQQGTVTTPTTAVIGLDRAKEIAQGRLPGGKVTELELDKEDGRWIYEGEIETAELEADFEIDAYTGEVLKWKQEAKRQESAPTTPNQAPIGLDRAKEIAQGRLSGGKITELELEKEKGRWVYEGEIETNAVEAEFQIDAYTGEVLKWKEEPRDGDDTPAPTAPSNQMIGVDRAKEIAQGRLPGGRITELELDEDDGRMIYEGEIETNTTEVEFEIDAYTGEVLKWDQEIND